MITKNWITPLRNCPRVVLLGSGGDRPNENDQSPAGICPTVRLTCEYRKVLSRRFTIWQSPKSTRRAEFASEARGQSSSWVILDNQSDVNLSVRQYVELLARQKVNFLLGPFASNFALADSSVAERYDIPMVPGGGASTEIYSRGFKFIF